MVIEHIQLDGLAFLGNRKSTWSLHSRIKFVSGPSSLANGEWHTLIVMVSPRRDVVYLVGGKKIKWPPTREQIRGFINGALELSGIQLRVPT